MRLVLTGTAITALLGALLVFTGGAQERVLAVEGRVVWIAGQRMVLAPDDTPPISIDLTRISQADLREVAQNDYVVVNVVRLRPGHAYLAVSIRRISNWFPAPPP